MKTNVFLALDNRRSKEDGTYSILLRIVHHRKSVGSPGTELEFAL